LCSLVIFVPVVLFFFVHKTFVLICVHRVRCVILYSYAFTSTTFVPFVSIVSVVLFFITMLLPLQPLCSFVSIVTVVLFFIAMLLPLQALCYFAIFVSAVLFFFFHKTFVLLRVHGDLCVVL